MSDFSLSVSVPITADLMIGKNTSVQIEGKAWSWPIVDNDVDDRAATVSLGEEDEDLGDLIKEEPQGDSLRQAVAHALWRRAQDADVQARLREEIMDFIDGLAVTAKEHAWDCAREAAE